MTVQYKVSFNEDDMVVGTEDADGNPFPSDEPLVGLEPNDAITIRINTTEVIINGTCYRRVRCGTGWCLIPC